MFEQTNRYIYLEEFPVEAFEVSPDEFWEMMEKASHYRKSQEHDEVWFDYLDDYMNRSPEQSYIPF